MPGIYLALLLISLAGLAHIDNRQRFVFYKTGTPRFRVEWQPVVVTALAVGIFSLWDTLGITLHIFFEGQQNWLLGFDLMPNYPIEELFFLTLFVYSAQIAMAGWLRFSKRAKREEAGK
ncbi:MAG: lycopene cyclase domain-containing protein [Micrococcales bacterium]